MVLWNTITLASVILSIILVIFNFDKFFNSEKLLKDIKRQDIITFLDSKIKSSEIDPEKKWITTWNHYFNHLKFFFRWLYNNHDKTDNQDNNNDDRKSLQGWDTLAFLKIKLKKTKRISPYWQNEIWDKDELLTIIKYEPFKRNKAALSLFWDLNARNHKIILKIKNIQLKEKYGEGEVPHEAKLDVAHGNHITKHLEITVVEYYIWSATFPPYWHTRPWCTIYHSQNHI